MPDLILKQLVAVIDRRTTMVCLRAAGQIQPVDQPFDTLMGAIDAPPFHGHCRTIVVPYMNGFVSEQRAVANVEIKARPAKQRRFGPDGYEGRLPPPSVKPPTAALVERVALNPEQAAVSTRVVTALSALRAADLSATDRDDAEHWVAVHRPSRFSALPKWIRDLVRKAERRKTR